MGRQRRKTALSAAVAIYLSLNIQFQDDHGPDWLLAIPLLPLSFWLGWGWQARLITGRLFWWCSAWWNYCSQMAVSFAQYGGIVAALLGIGCKASLYGLGIKL